MNKIKSFFFINFEYFNNDIKELYVNSFYKQIKDPILNSDCFILNGFKDYYNNFELNKKIFLKLGNEILKSILYDFELLGIVKDNQHDDLLYIEYKKLDINLRLNISPVLKYCNIVLHIKNKKLRLDKNTSISISKILNKYNFILIDEELLEKELSLFCNNLGDKTLLNFIELNDIFNKNKKYIEDSFKINNIKEFKNEIDYFDGTLTLSYWRSEIVDNLDGPLKLKHLLFGDTIYLENIGDFRKLEIYYIQDE